jgi:hypothetical protein
VYEKEDVMRKSILAVMIITGLLLLNTATAEKAPLVLKADGKYQFATFAGYRTHSTGFGATIEKHIGYSKKSFFFTFNYLTRSDDVDYLPNYDQIYYFAAGAKQYASYEQALHGPYVGLNMGLGIPSEQGVFWDFDFLLGYQVMANKLAIDLNVAIGYGVYSFREDYLIGSVDYWLDGFVFRPGLSVGLVF